MTCKVCEKRMKKGPDTNRHHLLFPRKDNKEKYAGQEIYILHIICHKEFHFFFLDHCRVKGKRACFGCKYTQVCCYKCANSKVDFYPIDDIHMGEISPVSIQLFGEAS